MDIVAHALWAGAAVDCLRSRVTISRSEAVTTIALAVAPDLVQLLPLLGWTAFGTGTLASLAAYSVASPGTEPALPAAVQLLAHHLHCTMHSAIIALAVTMIGWIASGRIWFPLLGWWLHIVIDVFTHSADYYPSPVFYPITMWGFNGIAWNEPWFLTVNYSALLAVGIWRLRSRRHAAAIPR